MLVNSEYNIPNLTKPAIKLNSNPVSTQTQPDDATLIRDTNTIPSNNKRVTITEDIKTNDNHNENFTKMGGGMQLDATPGPALKYGQLESEIFVKNSIANPQVVAFRLRSTLKIKQRVNLKTKIRN